MDKLMVLNNYNTARYLADSLHNRFLALYPNDMYYYAADDTVRPERTKKIYCSGKFIDASTTTKFYETVCMILYCFGRLTNYRVIYG